MSTAIRRVGEAGLRCWTGLASRHRTSRAREQTTLRLCIGGLANAPATVLGASGSGCFYTVKAGASIASACKGRVVSMACSCAGGCGDATTDPERVAAG